MGDLLFTHLIYSSFLERRCVYISPSPYSSSYTIKKKLECEMYDISYASWFFMVCLAQNVTPHIVPQNVPIPPTN